MQQTKTAQSEDLVTRKGDDQSKFWYRSRRIFNANGEWFFDTRENANVGPFSSEHSAAEALGRYIDSMKLENSSKRAAVSRANEGNWAVTLFQ